MLNCQAWVKRQLCVRFGSQHYCGRNRPERAAPQLDYRLQMRFMRSRRRQTQAGIVAPLLAD